MSSRKSRFKSCTFLNFFNEYLDLWGVNKSEEILLKRNLKYIRNLENEGWWLWPINKLNKCRKTSPWGSSYTSPKWTWRENASFQEHWISNNNYYYLLVIYLINWRFKNGSLRKINWTTWIIEVNLNLRAIF